MKLSWEQFAALFGRLAVEPGDELVINGEDFEVTRVEPDGVTLEVVEVVIVEDDSIPE